MPTKSNVQLCKPNEISGFKVTVASFPRQLSICMRFTCRRQDAITCRCIGSRRRL